MSRPKIPEKASANEVRRAIGFHDEQIWARFLYITKDEARLLKDKDMNVSWGVLPYNQMTELEDRINKRLTTETIPTVASDIIHWRMIKVFAYLKRQNSSVKPPTRPTPSTNTKADNGTDKPTPYDPVRDL